MMKPPMGSQIDFSHPLARGLVGCWLMNEGSGNKIYDLSSNGNDGTLKNGPVWKPGRDGVALSFDGTDDYVDCGNRLVLSISQALTILAWVKINGAQQNKGIITKYYAGGGKRSYGIYTDENSLTRKVTFTYQRNAGTYTADDTVTSASQLSDNIFTQVACVFIPSTSATVFMNGVRDAQDVVDIQSGIAGSTANLWLGNSGDNQRFSGLISSVSIYNRALSAAEIQDLYVNPYAFIHDPHKYWLMPQGVTIPPHILHRRAA